MENSEFVRQFGLEKFMDMQKEKYICSQCDGIISIHDRECSECQKKGLDKLQFVGELLLTKIIE